MKKHYIALCLSALILISTLASSTTLADTFASTSFEEPGTGGKYTDTGDESTDHPLTNNPGQAPVNYTSTGDELGFSSYYFNTRDSDGLTDGDFVGVTSYTGVVGSFPDGDQGFQISDPDGTMRTTLDTVDLSGYLSPTVSIQYFVQDDDWEPGDILRIFVEVDGGAVIPLVDTTEDDIDDLGIEGSWNTVSQTLTGYMTATLSFELEANSADEAVYFDNVVFTTESDLPPEVSSTMPEDGTTGVSLDTAITLTFDESVDIGPDALALECPPGNPQPFMTDPVLPALARESITMTTPTMLPRGTVCVITATASSIVDSGHNALDGNGDGVPGDDFVFSFATIDCGGPAAKIHSIQGITTTSPHEGNVVTLEGLVVGDFQRMPGNDQLSGFFLQEESSDWDADDRTSEGIFVYEGSNSMLDVNVGDKVRLTGQVDEYFDLTQIGNPNELGRCSSGHVVTPTAVTLPEATDGELEHYEGMLVDIASEMTVAQNYFLGRYGQMTLSASGRMFQPTNQFLPGSPEATDLRAANARNLLILDDGMDASSCGDNPDPVPYLGPPPPDVIRAGDTVTNLVGVLDYGKINSGGPCWNQTTFARDYRVHPTEDPLFTQTNPRSPAPSDVGGTLTVASFNVLNYFTTLGNEGDVCGPTGGMECRGAYDASEFARQKAKIVEAMCASDADVFGLMELENQHPDNDPAPGDGIANYVLKDLVGALNDQGSPCPTKVYTFTDSPAVGTDAIRQGIIYKGGVVTPTGRAVLTDTAFTDPNGLGQQKNRPAIAETFEDDNGEVFTVVVNHLKSKGSDCGGPPDDDPVQGNCNGTRTKGADYLADWLATDPTGSGDPDFLIIGDLNAYAKEDPIMELVGAGYTDLLNKYQGKTAYTYIFDGQSGYLDHALANPPLESQVTGAIEWHINTDEPPVIDYGEQFNPPGYYSPDPYRASDHDPVMVGLQLAQLPFRTYLPFVANRWPLPEPKTPTLHDIDNSDCDQEYTVRWTAETQWLTDKYFLEEAECTYFCDEFEDPTVVYSGTVSSWSASTLDREPGTYLYRVRGQNATGYGEYSDLEAATVVPEPSAGFLAAINQLDEPGKLSEFLLNDMEWEFHDGCVSYWPEEFYTLGEGDCKDFATFASYVLAYHGYYAEVVSYSGYWPDDTRFGHVVVIYEGPDGVLRYISNGQIMGEVDSVQDLLEEEADNANARIGHYLVLPPGTATVCTR